MSAEEWPYTLVDRDNFLPLAPWAQLMWLSDRYEHYREYYLRQAAQADAAGIRFRSWSGWCPYDPGPRDEYDLGDATKTTLGDGVLPRNGGKFVQNAPSELLFTKRVYGIGMMYRIWDLPQPADMGVMFLGPPLNNNGTGQGLYTWIVTGMFQLRLAKEIAEICCCWPVKQGRPKKA